MTRQNYFPVLADFPRQLLLHPALLVWQILSAFPCISRFFSDIKGFNIGPELCLVGPKNNLNLCITTEPVTSHGWRGGNCICLVSGPDMNTYINRSRTYTIASTASVTGTGFYAEIQIIFGTVCLDIILEPDQ